MFIESLLCALPRVRKGSVQKQLLPEEEESHGKAVMPTE